MKIVFLSPAAQGGGAESALLELVQALREFRPEWPLHLLAGEEGPMIERARSAGATCEVLAFAPVVRDFGERNTPSLPCAFANDRTLSRRFIIQTLFGRLRVVASAARYAFFLSLRLKQLHPDVIHSNGMKMHLLAALAKPWSLRRVPLVWHLHDYLSTRSRMAPILRRLARRCDLVLANSRSVASDAQSVLPARLPVRAVYNAIDFTLFAPDGFRLDLDQLSGLRRATMGTLRVGLVATFARWKGHEVFLNAIARINNASLSAPIRFYVVGGPIYATSGSQCTLVELKTLAAKLGVLHRVGFTGFVTDAPAAMRALDIVIHASTEPEPFGLVILQAMACGKALIASAAGGACELLVPEENALVHSPGNIDQLTSAIVRLIEDAGLRRRLGAAARAGTGKRFSRMRMAGRIVPLYENLVAASA